ncbi:hypothetical protein XENORESO_010246 [Xenotaenia resolanae]|uniref:Thyroglobulin type-1 domain-containing protein n=1 Tax=Xenotaenia resolanae TaxID=208358 RepID=A0ABV0WQG9_9TELE
MPLELNPLHVSMSMFLAVERQEEIIPEHPNNSNIRCSPQDKRCIQKTMARHPLKSTNLRSNSAREETKPVLAPCRAELQRALDRLASNSRTHDDLFTIPIPNCDKNGDFHPKQVCDLEHELSMSFLETLSRLTFWPCLPVNFKFLLLCQIK